MKSQLGPVIGWLLLIIGFGIYVYGMWFAIYNPFIDDVKRTASIPEPLDSIVSTIGAILLTNLGAVLGIAVTKQNSVLAQNTLIGITKVAVPDPMTSREIIQYVAVILYIIVLIACFACWAKNAFVTPDKLPKMKPVVPLVIQNGKALLGVLAAYIAFVLGVKQSSQAVASEVKVK